MHTWFGRAILPALALAGILAAAENPFTGTWKLNPAKSKFTGDTVKYESTPSGDIKETAAGQSYTFKLDGREYPAPFGRTAAWKQLGERVWEQTIKQAGKVLVIITYQLSADGETMTFAEKGTKPNGEPIHTTGAYTRVSGANGLIGTWKSTEVKIGSPNVLQITPYQGDGLSLAIVDFKATCNCKFDGKDYPCTGPTVPEGYTMALKRINPRTANVDQKVNGKPAFTSTFMVSEDGRTLNWVTRPAGVDEPYVAVYDRQ